MGPAGVSAERGHELVWFDGDVRGREAQPAPDLVPRLDRTRHRVLATQQPVGSLHVAQRDQPPHLRAVQGVSVDGDRRHLIDREPVLPQPARAASALSPEGEVEADHPAPQLHHSRKLVDEFLW